MDDEKPDVGVVHEPDGDPADEAGDGSRDDAADAVRRVRELLAQHVPLALIADLTDDLPPTAADLAHDERDAPDESPGGARHSRGSGRGEGA
ncbi:hypothetical protein [Cellulomonas alba]|uniref:Uncharacterized protein n=1 Tax=Cellulomonas alba TaxID=3053467 RepID=A0ABT7SIC9_9CELL|nr:hypothetical protein [Cellulomonas alba]MDM7855933.1 hypothetical protein [Cellulomonas alba]